MRSSTNDTTDVLAPADRLTREQPMTRPSAPNAHRLRFAPVALLALLALAPAMAFGQVKDDADFFSEQAERQADQIIKDIQQTHNKKVLVQTFPTIPDDRKAGYTEAGKSDF